MPTNTQQGQDVALLPDRPVRERPRQGPDTLRVVFAIIVVLLLTVLLAGALGASMQAAS